jgi:hypothetical protein
MDMQRSTYKFSDGLFVLQLCDIIRQAFIQKQLMGIAGVMGIPNLPQKKTGPLGEALLQTKSRKVEKHATQLSQTSL